MNNLLKFINHYIIFIKSNIEVKDYQPCKLDPATQDLISLCFDKDMFSDQLKKFEIGIFK